MTRHRDSRHRSQLVWGVAVMIGAAALVGAALSLDAERGGSGQPTDERALTRPIRVRLGPETGFDEFLTALRVYHYRVQPRGTTLFEDVYYDTEDWKLHRQGYSYRFRTRSEADRPPQYSLRLGQRHRSVSEKFEVSSDLPEALGARIREGAWQRAVLDEELAASNRLRALLGELDVEPAKFRPRLRAQLRRERFDVTDKGQSWFELDHENWSGQLVGRSGPGRSYEDVVIDTRLKRGHPEIVRRVSTMRHFSGLLDGARLASAPPQERAIAALSQD